jgi:hypothetical protein
MHRGETWPCCSNPGHPAVELPILNFRRQFQNDKVLIAKEMMARSGLCLASYVHMPRRGVYSVRKHMEEAKWNSPDEVRGHASPVRVRNGVGAKCAVTESFTILSE